MKLEPNELRIGNLTNKGKVKSFYENGVHVGFGRCYNFNELEPIPLTEEWLLKFGFINLNSRDFEGFEYHKFINGSEYLVWFSDNSMAIGGSKDEIGKGLCYGSNSIFEYVHQLQNLYFALTGKELEANI